MYRKKAFHLIIFCLLVPAFLASCFGKSSQPNATLIPPPEIALDSILSEAKTTCENAYSSPISSDEVEQAAVALFNVEYDTENSWELRDFPHLARTTDDIGSLICIKEVRIDEGRYSGGDRAYRQEWIVRVVSWPDRTVISEEIFIGGLPPEVKTQSGDAYGRSPYYDFMMWAGEMSRGRFFYAEDLVDFDLLHDGERIVFTTLSYTGVWDPARSSAATIGEYGRAEAIAYSPNGAIIAIGGYQGILKIIDADGQEGIGELMPFNPKEIKEIVFSPDGKYLAAGTVGGVVSVWAPPYQLPIFDLKEFENPSSLITDIAFSPDGFLITAAAVQSKIVIWNTESGEVVTAIYKLPDGADAVAFSPDGETLAIGGEEFLSLWDSVTGKQKSMLYQGTGGNRPELVFSPDGQILAVSSGDIIRLWDLITEEELTPLAGHTGRITRIEFSPTGTLISASDQDHTIRLWTMP